MENNLASGQKEENNWKNRGLCVYGINKWTKEFKANVPLSVFHSFPLLTSSICGTITEYLFGT
jgi:hypothetical protein